MGNENHGMFSLLVEQVQDTLAALEAEQLMLANAMRNDPELHAHYLAVIPYRRVGEEDRVQPIVPQSVTSDPASGHHLVDLVLEIRYAPDQSGKATIRAPGLVRVSSETMAAIHRVNQARQAFKAAITAIPTRQRRSLNRILPGICKLQAYRQIVCLSAKPSAVHFFWAQNKTGAENYTVADLKRKLQEEYDDAPAIDGYSRAPASPETAGGFELSGSLQPHWSLRDALEFDLKKLAELPDNEYVVLRRPIKPHPQCNVWLEGAPVAEDAYLPIFYPAGEEDSDSTIKIQPLPPIDPNEEVKRSSRNDRQVEAEPHLERINVYRKKPAYRKFEKNGE